MASAKKEQLIQLLSTRIHDSPFEMVSTHETRINANFSEGEWLARTDRFIRDANNNIPGGPTAKELTVALLSKSYANHLNAVTVKKLTKPLSDDTKKTATKKLTPTQLRAKTSKLIQSAKG